MRSLLMMSVLAAVLIVSSGSVLGAVPESIRRRPNTEKVHPGFRNSGATANVLIRLTDPPVVARLGRNAKHLGYKLSRPEQIAYSKELRAKQKEVVDRVRALGGKVVGRLTASQNAVLATVRTEHLAAIAALGHVSRVEPVIDAELDLASTLVQVGAAAPQAAGVTGEGIRVAVLDSGIDYTHRNFGGPGTLEAYAEAYGAGTADARNTTRDGLFPTEKVIGGWDYVGESWPDGELAPDEDPIDFGAHGTHVADILAGASTDGAHKGVAPGAKLYGFKVCSAVDTQCNGFAILLALEACLHPDSPEDGLFDEGDESESGIVDGPVDIVNLSLGSGYGQFQDASAYAVEWLTDFGIVVVSAAGNEGDRPYIVDSPGMAPGSLSVAQTHGLDAKSYSIKTTVANNRGGTTTLQTISNTTDLPWAPIEVSVQAPAVFVGRGCIGDAYLVPEASIGGKVVLIDRGDCNISEKVDRAARLGAVGVILVNNQPGDPPGFSQGEGSVFVQTLVVSQSDGNALKSLLTRSPKALTAFGPAQFVSLAGSMVTTSARGPSYSFQAIKPEIGAPGASVSADAGTGVGESAFGGTSGSTPVVAGAAALLQSASLEQTGMLWWPWQIKALLMNNAEPNIQLNPAAVPGVLAPITRIGAGELRIDRALAATAFAVVVEPPVDSFASDSIQASLSFGYLGAIKPGPVTLTKDVYVINLSTDARSFQVSRSFRYADDQATGAVAVSLSTSTLEVEPGGVGSFTVTLEIDPTKLPTWTLNGGTEGGNGTLLRLLEYDGYVQIQDARDRLSLPWHILPRKSADLSVDSEMVSAGGSFRLTNPNGATSGVSEIFALSGVSPLDYPKPDPAGFDMAFPDLKAAGVRVVNGNLELAYAFHHDWSHPALPYGAWALLDVNGDDVDDFWLLSLEYSGLGQAEVAVIESSTFDVIDVYPVDADLNASTMILRIPLGVLGLTPSSTLGWVALAWDNYFTGLPQDPSEIIDVILDPNSAFGFMRHKLDQPRYAIAGSPSKTVPSGGSMALSVSELPGGAEASPSQLGFLLLHRLAVPDRWSDLIWVDPPGLPE